MKRVPFTRHHLLVRSAGLVALVTSLIARAPAAVVPYSTDFSTDPGWSTTNIGTVDAPNTSSQVASGAFEVKLARTGSASSVTTLNSIQVTGLDNGGFHISATVAAPTLCTAGFNDSVGLRFLAANSNKDDDSYVADLNIGSLNPGRIRIVEFTGTSATIYPSSTQANQGLVPGFNGASTYDLDVWGQYNASGALSIDYKVTDQANPANVAEITNLVLNGSTVAPDSTPRTGSYFGFRSGIGSSGAASLTADFDTFSVVPEPATMCLLILGGLALIRRRA